jgi:hypothetical protein
LRSTSWSLSRSVPCPAQLDPVSAISMLDQLALRARAFDLFADVRW